MPPDMPTFLAWLIRNLQPQNRKAVATWPLARHSILLEQSLIDADRFSNRCAFSRLFECCESARSLPVLRISLFVFPPVKSNGECWIDIPT